ncbi:hypothetical protein K9K77_03090 [Candidatus Babeliales bacterium]|nr:hypothetical protein [Candidatus Babeliales bacterium]
MKKSVIFYVSFGSVKRLGYITKQSFCYKKIVLLSLFIINFSFCSQKMKLNGESFEAGFMHNEQFVPFKKYKKTWLNKLCCCFQLQQQEDDGIDYSIDSKSLSESLVGNSGSITGEEGSDFLSVENQQ